MTCGVHVGPTDELNSCLSIQNPFKNWNSLSPSPVPLSSCACVLPPILEPRSPARSKLLSRMSDDPLIQINGAQRSGTTTAAFEHSTTRRSIQISLSLSLSLFLEIHPLPNQRFSLSLSRFHKLRGQMLLLPQS